MVSHFYLVSLYLEGKEVSLICSLKCLPQPCIHGQAKAKSPELGLSLPDGWQGHAPLLLSAAVCSISCYSVCTLTLIHLDVKEITPQYFRRRGQQLKVGTRPARCFKCPKITHPGQLASCTCPFYGSRPQKGARMLALPGTPRM